MHREHVQIERDMFRLMRDFPPRLPYAGMPVGRCETELVRARFPRSCPRAEPSRWAEGISRCESRGNTRADEGLPWDSPRLAIAPTIWKSLMDVRLAMSGVTAWVASANSRATMQSALKLLFPTMRAPPSVTSPTARNLHDLEGIVLINYSLILVKRRSLERRPFFSQNAVTISSPGEGPRPFLQVGKPVEEFPGTVRPTGGRYRR